MGLWRNKNTVDPSRGSSRRSAESRGVPSPGGASEFDYRVNRPTWFSRLLLQPHTASEKVSIHIIRRLNLESTDSVEWLCINIIWVYLKFNKAVLTRCRSYTNHIKQYVIVNITDMSFMDIWVYLKSKRDDVILFLIRYPQYLLLPALEGWSDLCPSLTATKSPGTSLSFTLMTFFHCRPLSSPEPCCWLIRWLWKPYRTCHFHRRYQTLTHWLP